MERAELKKRTILFISHSSELIGGGEYSLCELVLQLHKGDCDCHVIFPSDGSFSKKLIEEGISVMIMPYLWGVIPEKEYLKESESEERITMINADSMFQISNYLQQISPDIVVTNTLVVPWGAYVAKAFGIPNIVFVHEWIKRKGFPEMAPTTDVYLKWMAQNVDGFIFNSEYTKHMYEENLQTDKANVFYPLVRISRDDIENVFKNNLFWDTMSIIIPNTIEKNKNQLEAIQAIQIANQDGAIVGKVLLIGRILDTGYMEEIQRFIKTTGMESIIEFRDFSDDLVHIYCDYNICISSSLSETFGLTVLEAQLLGRLIISSKSGGPQELIADGKTGLLYPVGDVDALAHKLIWVFNHKKQAAAIAARAKAEQLKLVFENDRAVEFIKIVESVLSTANQNSSLRCYNPLFAAIEGIRSAYSTLQERSNSFQTERDGLLTQIKVAKVRYNWELNKRLRIEEKLNNHQEKAIVTREKLKKVNKELKTIKASRSYRLGRAITAPVRVIRKAIKRKKRIDL